MGCLLIEGGTGRSLTAGRAVKLLAGVAIGDPIIAERVATCRQFVTELDALDQALVDIRARTVTAVDASKTTVIDVYGVGPIGAAIILGHSGDIRRFPTAGHYARHNGTAPIEASSGPKARHRLNPRGDRQLNHAKVASRVHPAGGPAGASRRRSFVCPDKLGDAEVAPNPRPSCGSYTLTSRRARSRLAERGMLARVTCPFCGGEMRFGGVYIRSYLGWAMACSLVWSTDGRLRSSRKVLGGTRARGASICDECSATLIDPGNPAG